MDHRSIFPSATVVILFHLLCITTCDPVSYTIISSENRSCVQDEPCLTFEHFVGNISQHTRNRTILRLNSGTHGISSGSIKLENVDMFSIISETTASINCTPFAEFIVNNVKMLTVSNTKFIGCGDSSGFINLFQSSVSINGCVFTNSRGKVIITKNSQIEIMHSIFKLSQAEVITARHNSNISVTNCSFELNSKTILDIKSTRGIFQKCIFRNNTVTSKTHLIQLFNSNIELNQCELTSNSAVRGRILRSESNSVLKIIGTTFKHNTLQRIGMLLCRYVKLTIENCTFLSNTVVKTGVLSLWYSEVEIIQTLEIINNSVEWGVLNIHESDLKVHHTVIFTRNRAILSAADIRKSNVEFQDSLIFSNNTGAIFIEESRVVFNGLSKFFNNVQLKPTNSSFYKQGGAIISIWSAIYFYNITKFFRNKSWKDGGAINAIESRLYTLSNAVFTENTAEQGGAVHLDQSYFICHSNCTFIGNTASIKGGAIHAVDSTISIGYEWYNLHQKTNNLSRLLSFVDNNATDSGGGISLEANAKVRGPLKAFYTYSIEFINNTAQKGTAIFVNDYDTCNDARYLTCFLQTPQFKDKIGSFQVTITSANSNSALYGGLLDRCIAKSDYKDFGKVNALTKGIDYFKRVTNDNAIERLIASDPVRLCYCQDGKMNCDYNNQTVETEKGRVFYVSVTAVDQVKHQVNATVQTDYHHSSGVYLREEQHRQKISNKCSNLSLNVYSSYHNQVILYLYAIGPCNGTKMSKRSLNIIFRKCTCPVGFQEMTIQSGGCLCDCDIHIRKYITKCNEATKSLLRQGKFWIDYLHNTTADNPYIIYYNCPYDYCVPSTQNVRINLNILHGADVQCEFHRTGLLCSTCKPPLSLSVGSSRCLNCTADWPKRFIAITIGGGLSGIAFVVIILVLNMTIAVGTLNGFVFYINIVASNNIIYRSSGSVSNTLFSVFIAWFNLELGIDTCFVKGLDTYSKVWLQFAFPIYLIMVLLAIIAISRCSSRFAQLIGKRNPVATLATIILVSYMKFLRNIIDILSFAIIRYPNGSRKLHWLPDANIMYFQGKHIPLFLIAVLVVIVGLSYTIFLFLWQCLLPASNYRLLRWIRNSRFNSFMEVNFAAYRPKHWYWIGLLLLIRVVLYLEIAYNYSDSKSSLLAAALVAASLLLLTIAVGGKVYRQKFVGCLNSFCYFNLLMLSVAQLYWQNNMKGQRISAEISVGASFILLIGVLIYHIVITLLEISRINQLKTSIIQRISKFGKTRLLIRHQETDLIMQTIPSQVGPTFTEVGLSDSREACTNEYGEEHNTSENTPPLSTTEWEGRDSLREPLLLD